MGTLLSDHFILRLSIIATLLYNSWVLSFFLNRPYFQRQTSDLEYVGQPHHLIFIACDIIASTLVTIVAWHCWEIENSHPPFWQRLSLIGYGLFGVFTAVSALILLNGELEAISFGNHIHRVSGLHDLAGGLAAFGLFLSMAATSFVFQKIKAKREFRFVLVVVLMWCLSGIFFYVLPQEGLPAILLQRFFIVLSSLWIYLMASMTVSYRGTNFHQKIR